MYLICGIEYTEPNFWPAGVGWFSDHPKPETRNPPSGAYLFIPQVSNTVAAQSVYTTYGLPVSKPLLLGVVTGSSFVVADSFAFAIAFRWYISISPAGIYLLLLRRDLFAWESIILVGNPSGYT